MRDNAVIEQPRLHLLERDVAVRGAVRVAPDVLGHPRQLVCYGLVQRQDALLAPVPHEDRYPAVVIPLELVRAARVVELRDVR